MAGRRTSIWEELQDLGRPATEYEELSTAMQWSEPYYHRAWRKDSTRFNASWENFRDPGAMTYHRYIASRARQADTVNVILEHLSTAEAVRRVEPRWVEALRCYYPLMRFYENGVSAIWYQTEREVLSSWLQFAAAFQAFDEFGHASINVRVSRALHDVFGGFEDVKQRWLKEPLVQPLRELLERLMCVTDWVERWLACGLLLEATIEPIITVALPELAARNGDLLTPALARIVWKDEQWHRSIAQNLVSFLTQESAANRELIDECIERWRPTLRHALRPFASFYERLRDRQTRDLDSLLSEHLRPLNSGLQQDGVRVSVGP